jgi:hypothetical protein
VMHMLITAYVQIKPGFLETESNNALRHGLCDKFDIPGMSGNCLHLDSAHQ